MPARRRCQKCERLRVEASFVSARGKVCLGCRRTTAQQAHRKQRLAVYELTPVEYEALMEAQGNCCAICGCTRRYNLHVDHDHAVERTHGSRASVRGGLCKRCNRLLAYAHDDIDLLAAAVKYLEHPPAWDVLGTGPS